MKRVYTGQPERLYIEYRDSDGALTDPSRPKVTIYAPSGAVVVDSADATNESVGIYYYNFLVSTAYDTERGTYQAWWEGYISSSLISMDDPIYFEVLDQPIIASTTSVGFSVVRQVRNAIGDNMPDQYMIQPRDMNYYIQDGFRNANAIYDFGYDVVVSTAGNDLTGKITFSYLGGASTSLPNNARTWYVLNTVKDIMEAQTRLNMFGPGIVNAGDVKINISAGLREQIKYLEMLKKDIDDIGRELKMEGTNGYLINTYKIASLYSAEL